MIRINLARKTKPTGGGLDLKSLNFGALFAGLRGGGAEGERKKFSISGPIPRALLAVGICYYAGDMAETYKAEELAKVDAEIASIEKEKDAILKKLAKIKGFEPIKKQLEDDEKAIRVKLEVVKKLLEDRNAPAKMLMQIAQSIPEEVWLTQLRVSEDSVKFSGATPSYNQVSDFIKSLGGTSQFADISLSGIQETGGADFKEAKVQTFDLNAKRRRQN